MLIDFRLSSDSEQRPHRHGPPAAPSRTNFRARTGMIAAPFKHGQRRAQHGGKSALHQSGEQTTSRTASIPMIEIEGMDVVDAMDKVKTGANDKPVKEVKRRSAN